MYLENWVIGLSFTTTLTKFFNYVGRFLIYLYINNQYLIHIQKYMFKEHDSWNISVASY